MNDIRDKIRQVIYDRTCPQCKIARQAGMKPGMLSEILTKRRKLKVHEFFVLCSVLELTPEQIRDYIPQPHLQQKEAANV